MFFGTFDHTIDTKGRMTIPVQFRELIAEGAFMTLGFDHNLMVMTKDSFNRLSERINAMSITNPTARELRRQIFANATSLELDKAGRILIPQFLRDIIDLNSGAVIIGAGLYFEIWANQSLSEHQDQIKSEELDNERYSTLELSL
ncbi:MAG: division/cell wall cluster transcriptional repressor MraZ [Chloroflexi bacterium HGW-Chloroflexi-10]|nr:MAG: division/cell wall cluster transcriptional repressor MraZ [Chloroflexi bacterium HGW-Chloroflexi-10]